MAYRGQPKSKLGRFAKYLHCLLPSILLAHSYVFGQRHDPTIDSVESAIRTHHIDDALNLAESSLRKNPSDFRLWTLEGIVFSIKNDNTYALKAFDRALKISPDYLAALKGEAQILYQTGDSKTLSLLNKIIEIDPRDTTAYEMLGVLYAKEGRCEKAVKDFRYSYSTLQNHSSSLESYGQCLMKLNRLADAVPIFQKLVELLPDKTYPKYDLGLILVMQKRNKDALKILEPMLAKNYSDSDFLSLVSEAYDGVGNIPQAVTLMRQAIVLSPSDPHYYVSFAALCLENDSFQIGIDVVNAGLSRIPDSASLYMARGLLYAELSQYGKAEIDFKMAQKLNPTQGSSSYALGLTEIQADHPDQAIEIIHNKLKSSPSDPLLYYLLAKIYLSQGAVKGSEQLNQAIHSALLAVRFKSDFVQARDILATAYLRNGEVKLAIDQCHKALLYDPSDQSAIYHLIIASRVSGNKAEIKHLAQQLERLQQAARNKEDQRKRYRLVESEPPNAQQE